MKRILVTALSTALVGCAPALADVMPGQFVPDPGRPGWRGGGGYRDPNPEVAVPRLDAYGPPAASPVATGGAWRGSPAGFLLPLSALSRWRGSSNTYVIAATPLTAWRGSGGPTATVPPGEPPSGNPNKPQPPTPPGHTDAVPGPPGLLAVAAAYGWARRLRNRIR